MQRGDIFTLRLPKGVGHEQRAQVRRRRAVGCVLAPIGCIGCANVDGSSACFLRPEIDIDGTTTRVLVEQVGAVDVGRLGELSGHLSPEEQWGVDAAILTVLGLN